MGFVGRLFRKVAKVGKRALSSVASSIGKKISERLYSSGEIHLRRISTGQKYNFCGPGTDLDARLNADGSPKAHSKPINSLDEGCRKHDLAYENNQDGNNQEHHDTRLAADKQLQQTAKEFRQGPDANWSDKIEGFLTETGMKVKIKSGVF